MNCTKCCRSIPQNAKFCPECGSKVEVIPKCKNGHPMKKGQNFCCECGAPKEIDEYYSTGINRSASNSNDISQTKVIPTSDNSKVVKVIAKVIATLIIMGIVVTIADTIGGVPTYIAGGIYIVFIPNVWKFSDEW